MICSLRTVAKSLLGLALMAGASHAATSWSTPAGSTTSVDYSNGATQNQLFTDTSPAVAGDVFVFTPNNFLADDTTPTTTDALSFVVTAKPGLYLQRITAGIFGDWSVLGDASPSASSTLTIKNLITNQILSSPLTFTPASFDTEDGLFNGTALIDLPSTWTTAEITLDGTVNLQQNQGTGAIQFKGADVSIQAAAVPLPGALAAMPFAMGVFWYARKRMKR